MKKLLLLAILIISSHLIFAQAPQDTIEIKKSAFLQNGKLLKPKQLLEITKTNPVAFECMQKARKNYVPAAVLGFIGGFGMGYSLGGLIGGRETNWTVFGIGAGFIAASIPFSSAYAKNAKKAVLIYNQGLQKNSF
jgi:hypothetical protein